MLLSTATLHSHTFPDMSNKPNPFGGYEATGALPSKPSAGGAFASSVRSMYKGNARDPSNVFARLCKSSCLFPHGKVRFVSPPRAAYSHYTSVGSLIPRHLQYASAS